MTYWSSFNVHMGKKTLFSSMYKMDWIWAQSIWFLKITFGLHLAFQPSFWPHLFWFLKINYYFLSINLSLINILVKQIFGLYLAFYGLSLIPWHGNHRYLGVLNEKFSKISMQIEHSILYTFSGSLKLGVAFAWPYDILGISKCF